MYNRVNRKAALARRHRRLRKSVSGTPERPRLAVFRSLAHTYVQIIDDTTGRTLVSVSTVEPELKAMGYGGNAAAAKLVGKIAAQRAIEKGIRQVVFDRGGNIYHGRVAALAEAAREGGLSF